MYEFLMFTLTLMYAAALFVFFAAVIGMACLLIGNTNIYKKYMRERRERLVEEFLKDLNK
jgi:uncharacterized membrane protein